MGNCDHQQFQFSIENIENFNDFEEAIDKSIDFEETIKNFNGFEETIGNCQWFWRTPSPLNVFWYSGHCQRWFFNGFWVAQPLVSMVYNGQGPLVKRWNGSNGSNRSTSSIQKLPSCFLLTRSVFHKKGYKGMMWVFGGDLGFTIGIFNLKTINMFLGQAKKRFEINT